MDEIRLEELTEEIEAAVADAQRDNPDTNVDDIFHDVSDAICAATQTEFPAEVDEFWRRNFGETYSARQREIRALQIALGRENNGPVGSE